MQFIYTKFWFHYKVLYVLQKLGTKWYVLIILMNIGSGSYYKSTNNFVKLINRMYTLTHTQGRYLLYKEGEVEHMVFDLVL